VSSSLDSVVTGKYKKTIAKKYRSKTYVLESHFSAKIVIFTEVCIIIFIVILGAIGAILGTH